MRQWSLFTFVLCALASWHACADDAHDLAEASLMVEGKVMFNPDGTISSYTLREPDKLPGPVVDLINQSLASWKLEFASIPAAPIEESMSLRIVATDADRTHTIIRVASAHFEAANQPADEVVHSKERRAPAYPRKSIDGRMSGTVYLLVRVGRDGTVIDAAAEQVNLHRYVERSLQSVYRKDLADAAVKAVKRWTFSVPTQGDSAQLPFWYVRVPIKFHLNDFADPSFDSHNGMKYGAWEIYVRGPRETIPWLQDKKLLADSPDSTPDGAVLQLSSGTELITPPASG